MSINKNSNFTDETHQYEQPYGRTYTVIFHCYENPFCRSLPRELHVKSNIKCREHLSTIVLSLRDAGYVIERIFEVTREFTEEEVLMIPNNFIN